MGLSWQEARRRVIDETVALCGGPSPPEVVPLDEAVGRVVHEDVRADRDQPPFDRATRDGFAVRAADAAAAPVTLRVLGELAAGRSFEGQVAPGTALSIMTGAPLPDGADAVVMVEHTARPGEGLVEIGRAALPGDNVVARGAELRAGQVALSGGTRLDPAGVALLASLGCARPPLHPRPRIAVLPTGDELVSVDETPGPAQIRNSNRHALCAQIVRAGGLPRPLPVAQDERGDLRAGIERGLIEADALVLSGGVSAGAYDFVEDVLADLGARIVFDSVDIRPGRPAVFAVCRGRPVFGLPGNPLSIYVTFELFVRPCVSLLGRATVGPLPLLRAPLAAPLRQRPLSLTVFVPARWQGDGPDIGIEAIPSQGSGDLVAAARADAFIVLPPGTSDLAGGVLVSVMAK